MVHHTTARSKFLAFAAHTRGKNHRRGLQGTKNDTPKKKGKCNMVQDPKAQIAALDARLGTGIGAIKERARLAKRIAQAEETAKPVVKISKAERLAQHKATQNPPKRKSR